MFDRTMLTLGAFKLDAVVLAPGETSIEELGERAIAVILVSGKARCNGVVLERWRHLPVTRNCCLETVEGCVVARVAIDGEGAVHLGRAP
ncbi:hypothetical protein [Nannocystis sp.]|uniref:hypothetical protein n=1 Tax=Nannocystis sp. TaxID=1962667 RepID=UPI002424A2BC|nr:hypothetical protein [Nannocystis sp.]MBK7830486.1 hypothetical protein [Nannocystis sp.]MBK9751887.1 hypothetical protein [Nannocystis sp.]